MNEKLMNEKFEFVEYSYFAIKFGNNINFLLKDIKKAFAFISRMNPI